MLTQFLTILKLQLKYLWIWRWRSSKMIMHLVPIRIKKQLTNHKTQTHHILKRTTETLMQPIIKSQILRVPAPWTIPPRIMKLCCRNTRLRFVIISKLSNSLNCTLSVFKINWMILKRQERKWRKKGNNMRMKWWRIWQGIRIYFH